MALTLATWCGKQALGLEVQAQGLQSEAADGAAPHGSALSFDDAGTPDEDADLDASVAAEGQRPGASGAASAPAAGEVEATVGAAKSLLRTLIQHVHLYEQHKEAELLQARLDLHKATGTPLPSTHSTPRSPKRAVAESRGQGGGVGGKGGVGKRDAGSRVGALTLALEASQHEVQRLRSHLHDVDALRRAVDAGQDAPADADMARALTLTLDLPYENWCDEAEDKVLEEVAMVAGVEVEQVSILAVSPGSVVLKVLIDAPDLASCVDRLQHDLSHADGHLVKSLGVTRLDPPPALREGYLPPGAGAAAGAGGAAWLNGVRQLLSGLASSTGGLAAGVVGGGVGGRPLLPGAEGLYSHQALEDAVVRAERAEARAATAEQHLVQLGTPREVLTVLQRKCSEAEVEASRARARLARLDKLHKTMEEEQARLRDELRRKDKQAADGDPAQAAAAQAARAGAEVEAALRESEAERRKLQDELRDVKAVLSQARAAGKEASSKLREVADQGKHEHVVAIEAALQQARAALATAELDLEQARQDNTTKDEALAALEQECDQLREEVRGELEHASQTMADLEGERSQACEASAAQQSTIAHLRADLERAVANAQAAASTTADLKRALVSPLLAPPSRAAPRLARPVARRSSPCTPRRPPLLALHAGYRHRTLPNS